MNTNTVPNTITMGNDEFILYIRKQKPDCKKSTAELGQRIWEWLQANEPNAKKVQQSQPCVWDDTDNAVSADKLPKTATQFSFNRDILPQLYTFLDTLCP